MQHSLFHDGKHHLQPLMCGGAVKIFPQTMSQSVTELISDKAVCRTGPATPGLLKKYVTFIFLYMWVKYEPIWLNFTVQNSDFCAYYYYFYGACSRH